MDKSKMIEHIRFLLLDEGITREELFPDTPVYKVGDWVTIVRKDKIEPAKEWYDNQSNYKVGETFQIDRMKESKTGINNWWLYPKEDGCVESPLVRPATPEEIQSVTGTAEQQKPAIWEILEFESTAPTTWLDMYKGKNNNCYYNTENYEGTNGENELKVVLGWMEKGQYTIQKVRRVSDGCVFQVGETVGYKEVLDAKGTKQEGKPFQIHKFDIRGEEMKLRDIDDTYITIQEAIKVKPDTTYTRQQVIDILKEFDQYCAENVQISVSTNRRYGHKLNIATPDGGTWFTDEWEPNQKDS